jgi:hypothetical protein
MLMRRQRLRCSTLGKAGAVEQEQARGMGQGLGASQKDNYSEGNTLRGWIVLVGNATRGSESDWRKLSKVCEVEKGGPVGIKRLNLTGRSRQEARDG